MQGEPDEAPQQAARAVELAAGADPGSLAAAEISLGALLALDVNSEDAQTRLEHGRALADNGRADLVALTLNYETLARAELEPDERIAMLRGRFALARRCGAP